jgi:hypothetical protein
MVKFFLIALVGTLTAMLLWLLPGIRLSATALELPEDLQDLLTQAASDLNFPYPGAIEKKSDDLEESPERSPLDSPPVLTQTPVTRGPAQAQEAQKAPPVRQRLD